MVTASETTRHLRADSTERSEPGYTFDFCGGQLAIDFTNTVGSRGDRQDEHLQTFGDLVAWAEARGVVKRAEAARLKREASRQPARARESLASALELRETLYRVIGALADGRQAPAGDLATLNAHVREALSRLELAAGGTGLALTARDRDEPSLAGAILTPVVRAAVDLVTSDAIRRVRTCADETCGWLFFDATRSRTRRWCDMKSCGNRAKVRRFRDAQ